MVFGLGFFFLDLCVILVHLIATELQVQKDDCSKHILLKITKYHEVAKTILNKEWPSA